MITRGSLLDFWASFFLSCLRIHLSFAHIFWRTLYQYFSVYKLIRGEIFVSKPRIILTPSHLPLPVAENECSPPPFLHYDMNSTLAQIQNGTFNEHFSYSSPCWKPQSCDRWQRTLVVIPYRYLTPSPFMTVLSERLSYSSLQKSRSSIKCLRSSSALFSSEPTARLLYSSCRAGSAV